MSEIYDHISYKLNHKCDADGPDGYYCRTADKNMRVYLRLSEDRTWVISLSFLFEAGFQDKNDSSLQKKYNDLIEKFDKKYGKHKRLETPSNYKYVFWDKRGICGEWDVVGVTKDWGNFNTLGKIAITHMPWQFYEHIISFLNQNKRKEEKKEREKEMLHEDIY